MRLFSSLALSATLLLGSVAIADESDADTCLRTKIWDGYNEGWAVRTATTASLGEGEHRVYLVTLYAGNEYRFEVCGDKNAKDVDIILHDANGTELMRDTTESAEPQLGYTPEGTGTFYVAVHVAKLENAARKSGVAMAVTYK